MATWYMTNGSGTATAATMAEFRRLWDLGFRPCSRGWYETVKKQEAAA